MLVPAPFQRYMGTAMPVRLKKLIGTFLLVALVVIYALVATTIASARLGDSGPIVHLAYFFFTGLLWILPAMWIIRWMVKEKPTVKR